MIKKLTFTLLATHLLVQNADSSGLNVDGFFEDYKQAAQNCQPLQDLLSIEALNHKEFVTIYTKENPSTDFIDLMVAFLRNQAGRIIKSEGYSEYENGLFDLVEKLDPITRHYMNIQKKK